MTQSDNSAIDTLEDLLWVVPRFVDRTSRQIELSRSLLSRMPCLGTRLGGLVAGPAHAEHQEPDIDVLEVLEAEEATPSAQAMTTRPLLRPSSQQSAVGSVPTEAELAIPQYDSLAASQVIPRLEMLRSEDLQQILAYEEHQRNRQTIVHKVRQLLAESPA